MAITIRDVQQATSGVSGTSLAAPAFATNPVTGESIIVCYASFHTGGTAPTHQAPTDTAGNTYLPIGPQQDITDSGSKRSISMWMAANITGGSSFVVTGHQSIASTWRSIVPWAIQNKLIYNGDFTATTTTSTNPTTGTTSPAPPASAIFIGIDSSRNGNITDGSGWNSIANGMDATMQAAAQIESDSNVHLATEYKISSSAQAATWTAANALWVAGVASFSEDIYTSGAFSSAGAGSTSLIGLQIAGGVLSAPGTSSPLFIGPTILATGALASTGVGATSLAGSFVRAGVLTVTGSGVVLLVGPPLTVTFSGAISANGIGTVTARGRVVISAGVFTSAGSGAIN